MGGTMLEGMCLQASRPCIASAGFDRATTCTGARLRRPRAVPMMVRPCRCRHEVRDPSLRVAPDLLGGGDLVRSGFIGFEYWSA